ncbi:hypothetical protein [Phenylobacterium sp.]|jgi:hypothetical protein|uniref:hypothetical protein n=1 Tax=Phenylobacterium sp. TaxID=1871053 RepID=UPI0037841D10
MLAILPYVADALWILVMAAIASTCRSAMQQIPKDARIAMPWSGGGGRQIPRDAAMAMAIGVPFVFGLILLAVGRLADAPDKVLIVFLARLATAPVFALVHIGWLRGVMEDFGGPTPRR